MATNVHSALVAASLTTERCLSTVAAVSSLLLFFNHRKRRTKVRARRQTSFDTLPKELQLEILKHLDWWDIIRARQVCRTLDHVSRTRSLWLCLFERYRGQDLPYSLFLNKTLESHSAAELEDVILGPQKADVGWMRHAPRIREVPIRDGDKLHSLLPGGRWLLATREKSRSVVCYDLADPDARRVVLVQSPLEPLRHEIVRLVDVAIDVDTSTPYLTFNLAILFCREFLNSGCSATIHVWRLGPRFDKVGRVVRFESQMLSTFDDNYNSRSRMTTIHIRGRHVAYGFSRYLDFVEWRKINNQSSPFTKIVVRDSTPLSSQHHILLRNDRVLGYSYTNVCLYDVSGPGFAPQLPNNEVPRFWELDIPPNIPQGPLGPLPTGDGRADQFLLLGLTTLSILTIPRDFTAAEQQNKPTIETLLHYPKPRSSVQAISKLRYTISDDDSPLIVINRVRLPHPGRYGAPEHRVFNYLPLTDNIILYRKPMSIDDISCRALIEDSSTSCYILETAIP